MGHTEQFIGHNEKFLTISEATIEIPH